MAWQGVSFCEQHKLIECEECRFDGRGTVGQPALIGKEDDCTFDSKTKGAMLRNAIRSLEKNGYYKDRPDRQRKADADWKKSYSPEYTRKIDLQKNGHRLEGGTE